MIKDRMLTTINNKSKEAARELPDPPVNSFPAANCPSMLGSALLDPKTQPIKVIIAILGTRLNQEADLLGTAS